MLLFIKAISFTIHCLIYCFPFFWREVEGPVGIANNRVRACVFVSLHIIRPVVAITLFPRCFLKSVLKMREFIFTLYTFETRLFRALVPQMFGALFAHGPKVCEREGKGCVAMEP